MSVQMALTNLPECLILKLRRWGVVPDTFLASESMKDTESDVGVSHVLFYRQKWMGLFI